MRVAYGVLEDLARSLRGRATGTKESYFCFRSGLHQGVWGEYRVYEGEETAEIPEILVDTIYISRLDTAGGAYLHSAVFPDTQRQEQKRSDLDEQLKEYIAEWRKQRAKEEEELKRLKVRIRKSIQESPFVALRVHKIPYLPSRSTMVLSFIAVSSPVSLFTGEASEAQDHSRGRGEEIGAEKEGGGRTSPA